MRPASTAFLSKRLFSQPTAPFREGFVRAELRHQLNLFGIPNFVDSAGNLIAGVRSFKELKSGFRIGLMAHMDHPGFHLDERLKTGIYRLRWYGGAPWSKIVGAKVRIHDPSNRNRTSSGTVIDSKAAPTKTLIVDFKRDLKAFTQASFGGFDFPGYAPKRSLVATRAADDLAGCVIALGALIDQEHDRQLRPAQKKGELRRLIGIFTRAEEVGFVGCSDLIERDVLPKDLWILSLEASKALVGAEAGKGPVLRIGDKVSLFDSEFSSLLFQSACRLESEGRMVGEKKFSFQRRLMDGGTCEATPLALAGFKVSGVAVPLINYHNIGPRGTPSAEAISLSDLEGARLLCGEFARQNTTRPDWKKLRVRDIKSYYRDHLGHLREPVIYDADESSQQRQR